MLNKHKRGMLVFALLSCTGISGCDSTTTDVTSENVKQPALAAYPAVRSTDYTETLHGTVVADPYRHLEEDSAATQAWVKAEQQYGKDYLNAIPNKQAVVDRITHLWNYEKVSTPTDRGDYTFHFRNDGLQAQWVLYVTDKSGAERVLLDPNTLSSDGTVALSGTSISKDGKTLAYGVSASGSDWQTWHFIDVGSGKPLSDKLEWIKFSSATWNKQNTGVYYARYDAPKGGDVMADTNYGQKIYFHKIGTEQSEDQLVYQRPDQPDWGYGIEVSEDGNYLLFFVSQGTDSRNRFFYKSLADENAQVVELLPELEAQYVFIGNDKTRFYFKTDYQAPNGKVIAIDIRQPDKAHWQTIIPESEDPISDLGIINQHLVVTTLHDVLGKMAIYSMDGKKLQDVAMPGQGSVVGPLGDADKDYFYYSYNSYIQPNTIYKYDFKTGQSSIYNQPKVAFDPNDYSSEQVFYTSKDGTRIPMLISYKKGMKKTGDNPTLLYAYGGFAISMTPRFSPANIAWMDMGGIYAVPNIRGGAEYGESWHQQGMLDKKQNVFDDYYAAAEYLIDQGYTNSKKLGAYGRSNGGLLMGAAVTQRPDLFAAVLPAVGVLDMLRFQKFTIGWAWTSEYGSADNAEQFPALLAYSPYHNVKARAYPATMIMTADHDDRVVPAHSFKFGAMMQAKQQGDKPIIMRIESKAGHGGGKPTAMQIDEQADIYTFLWQSFGLQLPSEIR
ncbi:prolyl oligopeptidase family serine peptidase [Shewanella sp.]|uniref:prolyl oligopeptidase family serine peptidase n=1 Tax=Shewanella sp. TaxID=50422 RepID=UPI003A96F219